MLNSVQMWGVNRDGELFIKFRVYIVKSHKKPRITANGDLGSEMEDKVGK